MISIKHQNDLLKNNPQFSNYEKRSLIKLMKSGLKSKKKKEYATVLVENFEKDNGLKNFGLMSIGKRRIFEENYKKKIKAFEENKVSNDYFDHLYSLETEANKNFFKTTDDFYKPLVVEYQNKSYKIPSLATDGEMFKENPLLQLQRTKINDFYFHRFNKSKISHSDFKHLTFTEMMNNKVSSIRNNVLDDTYFQEKDLKKLTTNKDITQIQKEINETKAYNERIKKLIKRSSPKGKFRKSIIPKEISKESKTANLPRNFIRKSVSKFYENSTTTDFGMATTQGPFMANNTSNLTKSYEDLVKLDVDTPIEERWKKNNTKTKIKLAMGETSIASNIFSEKETAKTVRIKRISVIPSSIKLEEKNEKDRTVRNDNLQRSDDYVSTTEILNLENSDIKFKTTSTTFLKQNFSPREIRYDTDGSAELFDSRNTLRSKVSNDCALSKSTNREKKSSNEKSQREAVGKKIRTVKEVSLTPKFKIDKRLSYNCKLIGFLQKTSQGNLEDKEKQIHFKQVVDSPILVNEPFDPQTQAEESIKSKQSKQDLTKITSSRKTHSKEVIFIKAKITKNPNTIYKTMKNKKNTFIPKLDLSKKYSLGTASSLNINLNTEKNIREKERDKDDPITLSKRSRNAKLSEIQVTDNEKLVDRMKYLRMDLIERIYDSYTNSEKDYNLKESLDFYNKSIEKKGIDTDDGSAIQPFKVMHDLKKVKNSVENIRVPEMYENYVSSQYTLNNFELNPNLLKRVQSLDTYILDSDKKFVRDYVRHYL